MIPKVGDKVRFIGATKEQIAWGNCSDPCNLTVGEIYTVENVDIRTSHTKVELVGFTGRFNSVTFELVEYD